MRGSGNLLPPRRPPLRPDVSLAIVNIVLLLILFFLASGALINASAPLNVELAETSDLDIAHLPRPVLAVTADGGLELDGDPVLLADLAQALAADQVLHLVIGREAPATRVLDLLGQPGLERLDVRLVTVHRRNVP